MNHAPPLLLVSVMSCAFSIFRTVQTARVHHLFLSKVRLSKRSNKSKSKLDRDTYEDGHTRWQADDILSLLVLTKDPYNATTVAPTIAMSQ